MSKILILMLGLITLSCNMGQKAGVNRLAIPELIDSAEVPLIELVLQKGQHSFYPNIASDTLGFNADYLGPSIRLHQGRTASIRFRNEIGEATTVHGHGLHVPSSIDGGPQQRIEAGQSWEIDIPVQQEAGSSWYHPHLMGKTAEHVHAGLAGFYLIEDQNSQSLGLPNSYGIDDIPLVIQDRSFTNGKMNHYSVTTAQMMDGLREDTLVVNGSIDPFHEVPKGWVRLRLLNGSNARFYRFFLKDKGSFYKIATEGSFLNEPVLLQELVMSPGERNEIMLDLSDSSGAQVMAEFLPADPAGQIFFMKWFNQKALVLDLRVDTSLAAKGQLPARLNTISYLDRNTEGAVIRDFVLEMDGADEASEVGMMFKINGKSMDMNVINEEVRKGAVEIWRITAQEMPHPFHLHGTSFQILSLQGQEPAPEDRGWKDTVVVTEEVTELIMRFAHEAGEETPYMYHCHILEHEDGGMMGQFTVLP